MPAEMGGYASTEGSKGAIYRHLCKEKEGGTTGLKSCEPDEDNRHSMPGKRQRNAGLKTREQNEENT